MKDRPVQRRVAMRRNAEYSIAGFMIVDVRAMADAGRFRLMQLLLLSRANCSL